MSFRETIAAASAHDDELYRLANRSFRSTQDGLLLVVSSEATTKNGDDVSDDDLKKDDATAAAVAAAIRNHHPQAGFGRTAQRVFMVQ